MQENKSIVNQFTEFFFKKSRLTLLIIPLLLIGGLTAYQTLKRDGFPPLEIPTVIVNIPYFVGDAQKVDTEATKPFEEIIKKVDGVSSFRSTTTDNFTTLVVSFEDNFTSSQGADLITQEYERNPFLNEGNEPVITALKVPSIDNRSDKIFSISKEGLTTKELQDTAQDVATQLKKLPEVSDAYVIERVQERTNPFNGQIIESRESFGRFVVREGEEFQKFDSVSIGIIKSSDDLDTLEISNAIKSEVTELQKENQLLNGYTISYIGDFADSLETQISSLESNAVSAVLIIVVIMLLLINWRSSLILALFFPLTLGGVFLALQAIGYSLNTITLFALILVLGLFVDDGIIIVEAIDAAKKKGKKGYAAVKHAIQEVGEADILGTLTTVLVFFPLLFVSGSLGEFIRLIPITVILALTISLVIALSILPFISSYFLPNKKSKVPNNLVYRFLNGLENLTLTAGEKLGQFIKFYLNSKLMTISVIIITLLAIIGGSFFASQLKFNIFPPSKDGDSMSIQITFNELSIERAIEKSREIDNVIIETLGKNLQDYEYFRSTNRSANISINLISLSTRDKTSVELGEYLDERLNNIEGVDAFVNTSIAGPPADPRPFKMQIYSEDPKVLEDIGKDLETFIQNTNLEGTEVTEVQLGDLNVFSKIEGRRYLQIEVGFDANSTSATITELKNKIENDFVPNAIKEFSLTENSFGFDSGFATANANSFASLQGAFIIALVVMYILLMLQFNSFSQPFLVLLAIPFSFALLFPGLYFTNNDLSFFVTVGLTALIGIVVNNSIVLIEFTNQARQSGLSIKESISIAITQRFRPILSTTTTSVAGLIPLALSEPFWEPLAFTIIFGLVSSTILVLIAYPAFFAVFEKLREKRVKFTARFADK